MISRHDDVETDAQITQCVNLLQATFRDALLGVYLYGSAMTGGLKAFSDIDLFVITRRSSTESEKKHLITMLLKISGVYLHSTKRPVELLIVEQSQVNPWHYPPMFDFQYGDWLRSAFEARQYQPWASKLMPDLALLVTQLLTHNKRLWGKPAEELLAPVPYEDVLKATRDELPALTASLADDTRNVLLTCARIWLMLNTGAIQTKDAAARWAIEQLPPAHQAVMRHALEVYLGEAAEDWQGHLVACEACVAYMRKAIASLLR